MKSNESIVNTIKEYILTNIIRSNVDLEQDTPLLQSGYLTSLQTLELVAFLSETYHIEIEPEEITEEEFGSLIAIAALVQRKLPT